MAAIVLSFAACAHDYMDSAESNHATEEGGVFLRLNIILLDDTERCLIAHADGINLMASQRTMEV